MQHRNRWRRTVGLFLCCCNFTYKRKNFYEKDKEINVHFKMSNLVIYLFSTVHTNNELLHSQGYDRLFLTPLSSHKCSLRLQLPSPAPQRSQFPLLPCHVTCSCFPGAEQRCCCRCGSCSDTVPHPCGCRTCSSILCSCIRRASGEGEHSTRAPSTRH